MSAVWGDRFRAAADLALAGAVVTVAALPVVTAGAAFAAGSFAMAHFVEYDTWPAPRECLAVFRRRLRPLLLAGPAVAAAIALVWLDVRGLHTGAVPGGVPMIVGVLLTAAIAAGLLGLAVVRAGLPAPVSPAVAPEAVVGTGASEAVVRTGSPVNVVRAGLPSAVVRAGSPVAQLTAGSRMAVVPAGSPARIRPGQVAAAAGVVGMIGVLALLVHPVLLPALVGYALYALHVVARRGSSTGEGSQDLVGAGAGHAEHEPAGQREHLIHG